jgi:[acyl-carrier-protein] S-malonyltransferase
MGLDFVEYFPVLNKQLHQASNILGYDVRETLSTDDGKLNQTRYTQPMMFLSTVFAYEALQSLNPNISGLAGFSLGEYSAFYAANLFSFEQMIHLVDYRAKMMDEVSVSSDGKMAAILGLSSKDVEEVCLNVKKGVCVAANYNSPVQTVISGDHEAVLEAIELAKAKGAKRAILLNVSGAFHSPLMEKAGIKLYQYLKDTAFNDPCYPIYMNTTSKPLIPSQLYEEMKKQIYSPVYFEQSIQEMVKAGFTHFIEVGPGSVLSGLIKKIDSTLEVINLGKYSDIDIVKGWLQNHGLIK